MRSICYYLLCRFTSKGPVVYATMVTTPTRSTLTLYDPKISKNTKVSSYFSFPLTYFNTTPFSLLLSRTRAACQQQPTNKQTNSKTHWPCPLTYVQNRYYRRSHLMVTGCSKCALLARAGLWSVLQREKYQFHLHLVARERWTSCTQLHMCRGNVFMADRHTHDPLLA